MMTGRRGNTFNWLFDKEESRLVQYSFLMLFVELVLIRWTGSNVLYLSYFSNFILLGSFLGIGIGFLRSKSPVDFSDLAPVLLALFVLFVSQFHVGIDRTGEDLIHFGDFTNNSSLPQWIFLPAIFLIVTAIMAAIADGVARSFQKFAPLQAYRLDILGSILGIVVFSICSFSNASPFCWGVIVSVVFASLLLREGRLKNPITVLQICSLLLLMGVWGKEAGTPGYLWSPYYKIGVYQYTDQRYRVTTNGIPQQTIQSLVQRKSHEPFYFIPYQRMRHPVLDQVLIIGAGTGGDVAIALKQGARHVDAVEIDPVLYDLGKMLNPNQPYHDPRVRVIVSDGRAFLQKSKTLYDVILFALPDSLTLVSGQSSLRLENYLFTLDAMSTVRAHLKPAGIFAMYNYYREHWLVDRLANTLSKSFHYSPCLDTYGAQDHWLSVLTISGSPTALRCPAFWSPVVNQYTTPSTDDHPFLYLKENHIPLIYLATLFFVFFTSIGAIKALGGSYGALRNYLDLFLMGAAFLLLETKSIVNFALFFGSTWFVNALVFLGILFSVYLSIETAARIKLPRTNVLYGALLLTLLVAWIIPEAYLLSLTGPARFIAATALAFAPIFIANLIFAERFRNTQNSTEAFGANLIGAILGGLLEYSSLIMGYHNLLILVALLYTLAIVIMSRSIKATALV